jgi:hypothetical protein
MKQPWFGPKAYGIGVSPASPAGWIATALFVLAVVAAASLGPRLHLSAWTIRLILLALVSGFFALVRWKGDKALWKWRWGGR